MRARTRATAPLKKAQNVLQLPRAASERGRKILSLILFYVFESFCGRNLDIALSLLPVSSVYGGDQSAEAVEAVLLGNST